MLRHSLRVVALIAMITLTTVFCFDAYASQTGGTGSENSSTTADTFTGNSEEENESSSEEETTGEEESTADPLGLVSEAALVMDADTGAVLYEKDGYSVHYPASITKIMTAILAIENLSVDDEITFSDTAVDLEYGASSIGMQSGEILTVEDCLYAMLLASANEVANALAEEMGGSIAGFGEMMTERAKELGCLNTNFTNPSGLFDESHYTTAYDMALIASQFLQYDTLLEVEQTLSYTIGFTNLVSEERTFQQKHKMAYSGNKYYYEGGTYLMGKTGYTDASGTTLVTCIEKDGITLIVVLFNASGTNAYLDTATLLDYGFQNYTHANIADLDGVYIDSQGILTSIKSQLNLSVDGISYDADVTVSIPADYDASLISTEVSLLSALEEDGHAGDILILYDGSSLCTIPFYIDVDTAVTIPTTDESEAISAAAALDSGSDSDVVSKSGFPTVFVLLCVIVVLVVAFVAIHSGVERKRREKRRRKYSRFNRPNVNHSNANRSNVNRPQ